MTSGILNVHEPLQLRDLPHNIVLYDPSLTLNIWYPQDPLNGWEVDLIRVTLSATAVTLHAYPHTFFSYASGLFVPTLTLNTSPDNRRFLFARGPDAMGDEVAAWYQCPI